MVAPSSKRIPISFSTEDFHLLYRVQEGYLYTGKSRDKMWQLADIIKAIVMKTWITIYRGDYLLAYSALMSFSPKNSYFFPETKDDYKKTITSYFASMNRNNEAMRALNRECKRPRAYIGVHSEQWDDIKTAHLIEGEKNIQPSRTKTNFILSMSQYEMEIFDDVKYGIQALFHTTISYSEMVRTLFRDLFSSSGRGLIFLSQIYIGALYDFSPQDSLLIFSQEGHIDSIQLSFQAQDDLIWIDRDSSIFYDYFREIVKLLKTPPELAKQVEDKKEYGYIIDLSNILRNQRLERRFRSSVGDFNFHSAFIGLVLISIEWTYNQHNPSILATYLTGVLEFYENKNPVKKFFGIEFSREVFSHLFSPEMQALYAISKHYQDNGGFKE